MAHRFLNSVWGLAAEGDSESRRLKAAIESHAGTVYRPLDKPAKAMEQVLAARHVVEDKAVLLRPASSSLVPVHMQGLPRPGESANPFRNRDMVGAHDFEAAYFQHRNRAQVGLEVVYRYLPDEIKSMMTMKQVKDSLSPMMRHAQCKAQVAEAVWDIYCKIPSWNEPVRAEELDEAEDQDLIPLLKALPVSAILVNEQVRMGLKATGMRLSDFQATMRGVGLSSNRINALSRVGKHIRSVSRTDAILAMALFVNGVDTVREYYAMLREQDKAPGMAPPAPR